jgi:hypothetical protein
MQFSAIHCNMRMTVTRRRSIRALALFIPAGRCGLLRRGLLAYI